MIKLGLAASAVVATLGLSAAAQAREYPIGGPVHAHDMEIVANYLVGVQMAPMTPDMAMGPGTIHLETDVHATADNNWGYPDGAWIPYLKIDFTLKKDGTDWQTSGTMLPMTAKDGPHYAQNVKMNGPGKYTVSLTYSAPQGFYRHTDDETGVGAFWQPFSEEFTFSYPQQ